MNQRAKAPPRNSNPTPPPGAYGRARALRELLEDPGYLSFKEQQGETLSGSERARLQDATAAADGGQQ